VSVVSDTGPLNYLILTESIHVLPVIFGGVYAPPAVLAELKRSRRLELEPVRLWANSPPRWLTIKAPAEIDRTLPAKLGRGEVEAISLAKELGADKTLLDDRDAREAAKMRRLEVVGTLGILEEAAKRRLVDIEQKIKELRKTSFRASETLYQSVLDRVREHTLAQEREAKGQGSL
jgi:predicted nucleic acid-binding protein